MISLRSLAVILLLDIVPPAQAAVATGDAACGQPGQWLIPPATQAGPVSAAAAAELLEQLAGKQVVLLGENHDSADDHRWQLDVLTALHERHPALAIGFEMFPRRVQGALDRWVAGLLSEDEFLRQAEWDAVWRLDAQLYLPLFRFARQHRLPMLALNVDRALVNRVRSSGWDGVAEAQREGVGRPAEPSPAYRMELQAVFDQHPKSKDGDAATRFARFVAAQTFWDRAMAEAIAHFRRDHPATLVVGILGAGHVRHGHGVTHQLKALGSDRIANLVTLPSDRACAELAPGLADAVYVVPPQPQRAPPAPPRLGVSLQEAPGGVRIEAVMPGSLAQRSGLRNGDLIVQAAGSKVSSAEDVRGYVQRQPGGTWLPLLIQRAGWNLEIVVRFPADPEVATPSPGKP